MAQRLAVATLVTQLEWQSLAEVTLPSQRAYAQRLAADFVVMDKRVHAHPQYDKWQLYELLATYDRVVFLDADVVVRPDCPDLFVCVPQKYVGGENELASFPGQAQHLERFCQRLGLAALPCPFYLNSGVFVASARHRELFRPPEAVPADLPWPEQSHFNARLIGEKYSVLFLPSVYNDRYRRADYLRHSFILHYSVMPMAERIQAARHDLAAWESLFRREL
jgi:hypothetical protein